MLKPKARSAVCHFLAKPHIMKHVIHPHFYAIRYTIHIVDILVDVLCVSATPHNCIVSKATEQAVICTYSIALEWVQCNISRNLIEVHLGCEENILLIPLHTLPVLCISKEPTSVLHRNGAVHEFFSIRNRHFHAVGNLAHGFAVIKVAHNSSSFSSTIVKFT